MAKQAKKKVLFLCINNSAQSLMAEALLQHRAGDVYDVYSAGVEKGEVDQRAIKALEKLAIDAGGLKSKHIDEFEGQYFDYVITLCEKATTKCRSYPNTNRQLAWDIIDPKTRPGITPFLTTLIELNNRLTMFFAVEQASEHSNKPSTKLQSTAAAEVKGGALEDFDPITFYKSLTDDIRLKSLMLMSYQGELCVCELMEVLEEDSQPKISRNLAVLRKAGLITDRKHGQWVFYKINSKLPIWAQNVIAETTQSNVAMVQKGIERLQMMQNRPMKEGICK